MLCITIYLILKDVTSHNLTQKIQVLYRNGASRSGVGGDVMVEDHQQEQGHPEEVGKQCQLYVCDHFVVLV